jgi:hypothetical protein
MVDRRGVNAAGEGGASQKQQGEAVRTARHRHGERPVTAAKRFDVGAKALDELG